MAKSKILVTRAGGKTGLHTALMLRHRGFPVRTLVRRHDHRSERLEHAGAEVTAANQYVLTDMRAAMCAVQRAHQCAPTVTNCLQFNAVFTAAASEAWLEHAVMLSQWLSSANNPSFFTPAGLPQRYRIRGPLDGVLNCHCSMCRKAHGAAFRTRAAVRTKEFEWRAGKDLLTYIAFAPGEHRTFCSHCGANLVTVFADNPESPGFPLGRLDDDPGVKPEKHVFVGSKAPWQGSSDDLPQWEEMPEN